MGYKNWRYSSKDYRWNVSSHATAYTTQELRIYEVYQPLFCYLGSSQCGSNLPIPTYFYTSNADKDTVGVRTSYVEPGNCNFFRHW
jgi:hypothetical protein